jgi:hypothetical protein
MTLFQLPMIIASDKCARMWKKVIITSFKVPGSNPSLEINLTKVSYAIL